MGGRSLLRLNQIKEQKDKGGTDLLENCATQDGGDFDQSHNSGIGNSVLKNHILKTKLLCASVNTATPGSSRAPKRLGKGDNGVPKKKEKKTVERGTRRRLYLPIWSK